MRNHIAEPGAALRRLARCLTQAIIIKPHKPLTTFFVMQGPLNEPAFEWAKANVPFFESSDKDLEKAYAFRWRAYFTHIIPTNMTTNPWVISECFSPTIPGRCSWAAPSGAINAAAGHHIRVKNKNCRCL